MKLDDLKLLKELLLKFVGAYCDDDTNYSFHDVYSMLTELIIKKENL